MSRGRRRLESLPVSEMTTAAFFDLDKTIIAKSSVLAFGRPFYRKGLLSRRAIVQERSTRRSSSCSSAPTRRRWRSCAPRCSAMTRGLEPATTSPRSCARRSTEVIDADHLRRGARAVRRAPRRRAQGRDRLVVTGRGRRPLGEFLGVDEVIAHACRGRRRRQLHRRARVLRVRRRSRPRRSASSRRARTSTSTPRTRTATPSPTSRCSSAVGHPVAVNPDKDLVREAKVREWEIRVFARPVRLRDRVPVPPRGPTIAVGGMLAAAGAGAVVWWLLRRRPPPPTTAARLRQLVTR